MNKNWEKDFTDEFGIHFKDSSGELQFALAFISGLLEEQKQEIVEEIEIRDAYKLPFSDNEIEQYLMDNERHWRMQANIWYQKGRDDENQELKQTLNK